MEFLESPMLIFFRVKFLEKYYDSLKNLFTQNMSFFGIFIQSVYTRRNHPDNGVTRCKVVLIKAAS